MPVSDPIYALTLVTALGCGVAGGVFFAFSSFAMAGLARLPAPQAIAAMQSINVTAVTPVFMTQLFGTALACVALEVWALASWGDPAAPWLAAGSALYVIGTIVLTITRNVPLNNMLEALDPHSRESVDKWNQFLARWTAWNHVRAAAAVVAAGLLAVGLAVA